MDQIKVGHFLAQLRKEHEWTQEQLAEKLSVTGKTVSRWENGNYMPDIDTFLALSKLYEVSICELISGERLSDEQLRERSDDIVVSSAHSEAFQIRDKMKFWKKKWKRDHRSTIILLVLLAVIVYFAAFFLLDFLGQYKALAGGVIALIYVCVYGFLRNRMMRYVEEKVFG